MLVLQRRMPLKTGLLKNKKTACPVKIFIVEYLSINEMSSIKLQGHANTEPK